MATSRIIKVRARPKPPAPVKKARANNGETVSGGMRQPIGYTAGMNELTVSESIFGLFAPNSYREFDIQGDQGFSVIEPVFPIRDLMKLYMQSTILRQCVEAYRINIESYGHALEYVGPEGQQDSLAARNEKARLERVIDNLTTDGRPLQKHREDARVDLEVVGARAFEIGEDAVGRTVLFNQVQSYTLRMTKRERDPINVSAPNPLTGGMTTIQRRFRRFLQIDEDGRKVWFKEYGDPRSIDPKDGRENPNLSIEGQATAIYYEGLYTPGTPYGTPRWLGTIPSLMGSREAEMVNLDFFRDNAIPALAVMVSGGALTAESFDKIEQYIAGVRGRTSMNRIVVLEASADSNDTLAADGSLPAPKIDIKPMLSERQHEGLFANYVSSSDEKARSSMRLPPVFIGSAKEYNRASAFASMLVADQQIFIPERRSWDDMFHRIVISTHSPKFWRFRSLGVPLSDPQEVSRVVDTLSKEGGLTPNIAIKLANRYLDANVEAVHEEWGDFPFAIVMQALQSGAKLKGLEAFYVKAAAVAAKPPATAGDETQNNLKKGVHLLFDELSEDLQVAISKIPELVETAVSDYKP